MQYTASCAKRFTRASAATTPTSPSAIPISTASQSDLDRDIGIYGESGLPVVFGLLKLYGAGGIVLVRGARPLRPLRDVRPGVAADGRFRRTGLRVANPMTRQAADGTTCCNGCDENQFVQAGLLPVPAHCLAGRQVQAQGQALWPGRPPLTPAQSAAQNRIPGSMRTRRRNAKPSQWNPNAREVALACGKRGLSPQRTVSQAIGGAIVRERFPIDSPPAWE